MPRIKNWEKKLERQGPESESVWEHKSKKMYVRVRQADRSDWVAEKDNSPGFESPTPITQNRIYKRQRFAKRKAVEWMKSNPNP